MVNYPAPVCYECKWFNDDYLLGKASCTAYKVIPKKIFFGGNDHKNPCPGDHGIQFEPTEKKNLMTKEEEEEWVHETIQKITYI